MFLIILCVCSGSKKVFQDCTIRISHLPIMINFKNMYQLTYHLSFTNYWHILCKSKSRRLINFYSFSIIFLTWFPNIIEFLYFHIFDSQPTYFLYFLHYIIIILCYPSSFSHWIQYILNAVSILLFLEYISGPEI